MSKDIGYTELFNDQEYLCKEMVWDVQVATTIEWVRLDTKVPHPKSGQPTSKYIVKYAAFKVPHVLNKTNKKALIRWFGGTNTSMWQGHELTVYVDKNRRRKNPDGSDGMIALMYRGDHSGEHAPSDSARPVRRCRPARGNGARSRKQPAKAAPPPARETQPSASHEEPPPEAYDDADLAEQYFDAHEGS